MNCPKKCVIGFERKGGGSRGAHKYWNGEYDKRRLTTFRPYLCEWMNETRILVVSRWMPIEATIQSWRYSVITIKKSKLKLKLEAKKFKTESHDDFFCGIGNRITHSLTYDIIPRKMRAARRHTKINIALLRLYSTFIYSINIYIWGGLRHRHHLDLWRNRSYFYHGQEICVWDPAGR